MQDICGLQPLARSTAALNFGTVMHSGAAAWWRTSSPSAVQEAMNAKWLESFPSEYASDQRGGHTRSLSEYLAGVYVGTALAGGGHWAAEAASWEPLAIEERVILNLGPEGTLSFQLDRLMVGTLGNGEKVHVLTDLKTAGRIDKRWRNKWVMSLQQKLYRWAVEEKYGVRLTGSGHYIEGLWKDMTCRQPEYVQLPDWSDSELEEAVMLLKRVCQKDAALVARCQMVGGAIDLDKLLLLAVTETDTNEYDCFTYGECPLYAGVCTKPVSERVGTLRALFEYVEPTFLE